MKKELKLNLMLFEGGAPGAGAAATGGSAGSAPESGSGEGTPALTTEGENGKDPNEPEKQAPAEKTPEERRAEYGRLKTEYRDLYEADVKGHLNRRFKETEKLHEQLNAYTPLMDLLSERYGIENADIAKIMEAIDQDNSFWEEQALKENMTVEQVKRMRKMEAENHRMKEAAQRAQQIRQRDDTYARWDEERTALTQEFPDFDMAKECENPDFVRLLQSGIEMGVAYKAIHFNDIAEGIAKETAKKTKENVANNIRSGTGRPLENGVGSNAAAKEKINIWDLSKEEFDKLLSRVENGETIKL